jgi:hypothetical protein
MSTDLGTISRKLKTSLGRFGKYRALLFFVFVAFVYAFIVYRINVLSSAEPDPSAVASASKGPKQPRIDPAVVEKIEELEDNSVNVQSLFDQARQNPFQE